MEHLISFFPSLTLAKCLFFQILICRKTSITNGTFNWLLPLMYSFNMCFQISTLINLELQTEHLNGFCPSWLMYSFNMCFQISTIINLELQTVHLNGFCPSWLMYSFNMCVQQRWCSSFHYEIIFSKKRAINFLAGKRFAFWNGFVNFVFEMYFWLVVQLFMTLVFCLSNKTTQFTAKSIQIYSFNRRIWLLSLMNCCNMFYQFMISSKAIFTNVTLE